MDKCQYPEGMDMKIDDTPVDPCIYEDVEVYNNVTVIISKCTRCGHVETTWLRQNNTEKVK